MIKPTFGTTEETTVSTPTEKKPLREEIGAIWTKTSAKGNQYMKMVFTKEKLQEILKSTDGDKVSLLAFSNKSHEGVEARPNFRIFERQERD